jgi:eukaryotic-like serine/threonine-protein kinase
MLPTFAKEPTRSMNAANADRWARVHPLLDEALELASSERDAWLDGVAKDQPDIAAELRALLAAHADSDAAGFLAGKAALPAAWARHADELPGLQLGSYTLERRLGQGGMGSVWLARRNDGRFSSNVAVKLLNLSHIDRAGGERFQREGRILAQLAHPNIARLIDAGVTGAGQPYLTLEYVEGETIDAWCDDGSLDIAARIRLFLDLIAAVAHSHANLIVHRDIKPLNVLVAGDGTVKLLDFGIAKLLEGDALAASATELTRDGGRALTPAYAAPEQLRGEAITTATDVYALGVLLYELLGGVHPAGSAPMSATQLERSVIEVEPPRMSDAASAADGAAERARRRATTPDKLRRLLRGDLDNIVAKAIKKEPAERYGTVEALADDLRRYLDHQPVVARPDTFTYRLGKFTRRYRGAVATGVLTAAAIVAGLVGTTFEAHQAARQAARAEQAAHQAQHQRDRALRELTYAEAVDELLGFLLQESSGKPFGASQLLDRGEGLVERQFAHDPALRARLLTRLATLYGEAMEANTERRLLTKAQAAAATVDDPGLRASIECDLAERDGDDGAFDRAMPIFDRTIARVQADPDHDPAVLAGCLSRRAGVNNLRGDAAGTLADAKAALALMTPPRPGQRIDVANVRTTVADAQSMLGQEALGAAEYERALAELDAMGRGGTLNAVTLYNNLGVRYSRGGQWLRAADVYRRGLAVASGVERDGSSPPLVTNYAKLLVELGRPEEAKRLFEQAMAAADAREHARSTGVIALMAAPAWCATDDLAGCARLLATARQHLQSTLPPRHPTRGTLAMEEGELALGRGDVALARSRLREAIAMFDTAVAFNPNRLRTMTLLARADLAAGDSRAALADAHDAVAAARASLAGFPTSAWLGDALLTLGSIQRSGADPGAADASLREALVNLQATVGADAPATRETARLLAAR